MCAMCACLKDIHPEVNSQFQNGNFTIHKTRNPFSAISIDQAHEQNNAMVKGDGGAVDLTANPGALRHWTIWMVSGPEISRVVSEFELSVTSSKWNEHSKVKHHEK